MDTFDALEWILSGKPVPFEVGGSQFALRQPSPLEMDKMRFAQTKAHDRAFSDYRAEGLDKEPVTAGLVETKRLYMATLEAAYQQANETGDGAAARQAAEDMESAIWPANLAEERARDYARRALARWMLDNLLTGDKDELRRLAAPDPLGHDAVIQATQQMLAIINHDPNSKRRTQ